MNPDDTRKRTVGPAAIDDRQLEDLLRCADDPVAFAKKRRALIEHFLSGLDGNRRRQAERLQHLIDAGRATAVTPSRALKHIMETLGSQAEALENLSEQIRREAITEAEPVAEAIAAQAKRAKS